MAVLNPIHTYHWVIYYANKISPPAPSIPSPRAVPSARPMAVTVYHRDVQTIHSLSLELPRNDSSAKMDQRLLRGDLNSRVTVSEFHPSVDAADAWMKGAWDSFESSGAIYAELHGIVVDANAFGPAS